MTWADFVRCWSGSPSGLFAGYPLLLSTDTAQILEALLGKPAPGVIQVVPEDALLECAWTYWPTWAVIPFEVLGPRWKVLRADGYSPLDRKMDRAAYPLIAQVLAGPLDGLVAQVYKTLGAPLMNRDPQKIAAVLLTGVTALTRDTAMRMDWYGSNYPAQDISPWLLEPDITHISNEVSFSADCPPPTDYATLKFCSDPRYVQLLKAIDVDVIELTGNHLLDWGSEAFAFTLQLYEEQGFRYYGGGWNLADAQRPLTVTVRGTTLGFLGCNVVGPRSDWATEDMPGSAVCDYVRMIEQIREMRDQGIVPIVTLQYIEYDQYEPTAAQRKDFRRLAEAGAAIVSGSQAHRPQGFDFYGDTFTHYGLGNLFFDRMWPETRQAFLDRHVFDEGRHISTELLTVMLEDYSRPRPMTIFRAPEPVGGGLRCQRMVEQV